jgi:hypothetical protein
VGKPCGFPGPEIVPFAPDSVLSFLGARAMQRWGP